MTQFESFDNSNKKFQKIWEQNEENTSEIENNLKKFEIDFNSVNFAKKVTTISIFKDRLVETFLDEIAVIDLINIPEWLINHINIIPIVSPIGDINTDTVTNDLSNLKIGDIIFISISKHWIAKLDENNYQLKIRLFINPRTVVSVDIPEEGNFNTEVMPFKFDLSLKIINPRIYENTNIHKT